MKQDKTFEQKIKQQVCELQGECTYRGKRGCRLSGCEAVNSGTDKILKLTYEFFQSQLNKISAIVSTWEAQQ